MKKILQEFRDFAVKGNAIDMAVGIIIGAAFGKIVTSLVNDVLMPPIGLLLGNMDFSDLAVTLKDKTDTTAAVTLNYGLFINNVIDFLIVGFTIFIVIKQINRFRKLGEQKKEEVAAAPTTKECPKCFNVVNIKATRCPHCTSEI